LSANDCIKSANLQIFLFTKPDCLGFAPRSNRLVYEPTVLTTRYSRYPEFTFVHSVRKSAFGHLYSTNFRPFLIGKSWIASGFRPRNDMQPFQPKVLKKGIHDAELGTKTVFQNEP